jgi:hypothetical protein
MDTRDTSWAGTATELLAALAAHVPESQQRGKGWPAQPNLLTGRLRRMNKIYSGPALREALSVDLREMVIRAQEQHEFLSIRKEAGLQIDPATADVTWEHTQLADPYGIRDLSPEEDCIGRVLFARAPGGDIWVSQCELPSATVDALRLRLEQEPEDLRWLDP